jgi:hypothetical protein
MAMNLTEVDKADIVCVWVLNSSRPVVMRASGRAFQGSAEWSPDRSSFGTGHCLDLACGCARARRKAVAVKLGSSR